MHAESWAATSPEPADPSATRPHDAAHAGNTTHCQQLRGANTAVPSGALLRALTIHCRLNSLMTASIVPKLTANLVLVPLGATLDIPTEM